MGNLEQLLGSLAEFVDLNLKCASFNRVADAFNVDIAFVGERMEH